MGAGLVSCGCLLIPAGGNEPREGLLPKQSTAEELTILRTIAIRFFMNFLLEIG